MVFDRVQLKMTAKQAMKFQRPHPMLITLLFVVLVNAGTWIINQIMSFATADNPLIQMMNMVMSGYADPEDVLEYLIYAYDPGQMFMNMFISVFVVNILTSLWTGLMRTGYSGFCLGMVRGQQPQANALFNTLPLWAGVLLTQFLVALFSALWGMLFIVGVCVVVGVLGAVLIDNFEGLFVLLMLAAIVVAVLGYVWVVLRYAMVNFIIADQGLTGMDAIRESKRMMQGNISSLFTLELSFIGWYMLEGVIVMVIYIAFAGSFAARLYGASGYDAMMMMSNGIQGLNTLSIVITIATTLYSMWLTPYVTGTEALFYDTLRGARPMGGYGGPAGSGGYGGQGGQGGWGGPGAPGGWGGPGGPGGYGGPGGPSGPGGYGGAGGYGGQGGWGQQPPQQNGGYNWTPTPGSSSGRGMGTGAQGGPRPPQPPQQPPKAPRDDAWK